MLYGVLDAYDSIGATAVFPGRLDRALGRLGVGRLRRWQEISEASSSILASALVLIRSLSLAFLFANVSTIRMLGTALPGCLYWMLGGDVDDRACDQR